MLIKGIKKTFSCIAWIFLMTAVLSLPPASANTVEQPIIALSSIGCNGFYLLEIFQNGDVVFRAPGYMEMITHALISPNSVKLNPANNRMVVYKSKINQKKLDALLTKIRKPNFLTAKNHEPSLSVAKEALRFREGNQIETIFSPSSSTNPLIKILVAEIIETAQVIHLIPWKKEIHNPRIKAVEGCLSSDISISFEELKVK